MADSDGLENRCPHKGPWVQIPPSPPRSLQQHQFSPRISKILLTRPRDRLPLCHDRGALPRSPPSDCSLFHADFSGGFLAVPLRISVWGRESPWPDRTHHNPVLWRNRLTTVGSQKTSVGPPTPTESDDETVRA